ncbi:hypothetical protein Tco_0469514 [Tanacetum coccineum]
MSNMSEDIQYAGSDTRPPMLDRTDFESWQQCIRLYCLGKDNGENIMKSITEGSFKMGTYKSDIRATNILLQGIPKDIYTLINHYTDAKDIWDNVKMILEGSELTKDNRRSKQGGNVNPDKLNPLILDEEQLLFLAGEQVTNFDADVDDPTEKDLALNLGSYLEAYQCDASDSNDDEAS